LFQLTEYLNKGEIIVQVYGKQRVRNSAQPKRGDGPTTKDMLKGDKNVFSKYAPHGFFLIPATRCHLMHTFICIMPFGFFFLYFCPEKQGI
jgi:hypothetical protein